MSPEQVKLREIFSEALAKASTEERERYLASACGDEADLRRQIDVLLEAHGQSGDFLKQNVIAPNGSPIGKGPGSVIGRYKLLQQIGEGGFGIVFMAEQQEPVRRMVALKILKPGMDTKEVVARFEAGRQALALMDHPNIARVLDGGATESGRPYFVMELVKGIPITDFCEQHRLMIEERLRLFMKVCAGVQHAHQKGVIHRDLKPSNVLVTLHDGEPVPKVIDFGIAKAIGQKLTERTLFTRFEQLIGTPAYMSPEQAEWSGLDIDTRSDLYSLGVLLYELLTGTTPLEKETLARAALDEMRRMIREAEPPKPSTRLEAGLRGQKSEVGSQKAEVGGQRAEGKGHTAPSRSSTLDPQLSDSASLRRRLHAVRGDLDWIVMKALEKNRTRRYETVNGLARDIERHLKGEPVVACPPSKTYLAGKFIRKHRLALTAVAGVALVLAAGLVLALLGFAQARHQRQRAEQEAAVAEAVNQFLTDDLLGQASPYSNTNRNVTVRELLDRAAEKLEGRFANQPLVEASIRQTLALTYDSLAETNTVESNVRRAVDIRTRLQGPDHGDTISAKFWLAFFYQKYGKREEAESLLIPLLQTCRRIWGAEGTNTLACSRYLATLYKDSGHLDQAERILPDLLEKEKRVLGPEDRETQATMSALGSVYSDSGRFAEAAALAEEGLRIRTRIDGPAHPETIILMHNLAVSRLHLGSYTEAIRLWEQVVELNRRVLGPQHPSAVAEAQFLVQLYGATGSWQQCLQVCRELTQCTNNLDRWEEYAYRGAVAALVTGDTNRFQEFSARLLSEFGSTTNALWAREVAELCLLTPEDSPNLEPALKLVELVPSDDPTNGVWNSIVRGMAEYRRGNLQKALRWFDGATHHAWSTAASQASYFCAMIHYREGDFAAARADLALAEHRLAAYVRPGDLVGPDRLTRVFAPRPEAVEHFSRPFAGHWHEYGRVVAVRREAEHLILGKEVSPQVDAAWLEAAHKRWEPVQRHLSHADKLAGRKELSEASAEFLTALREPAFDWEAIEAVDHEVPQRMGTIFLLTGDHASFEQLCRDWFKRLEQRPDPFAAYLAVRLCLAGEGDVTSGLGQLAIARSSDMAANPNPMDLVRAMMAYRLGNYQEAIQDAKVAENSKGLAVRAAAQIFRAMALAKSGLREEGKKELALAEAQLGQHLANMTGDVWWDLGFCQLALNEAHELFSHPRQLQKARLARNN